MGCMHNWLVCEIATKKGVGLTVRLLLGTTWGPGLLSEEETANQKGVGLNFPKSATLLVQHKITKSGSSNTSFLQFAYLTLTK